MYPYKGHMFKYHNRRSLISDKYLESFYYSFKNHIF